MRVGKLIDLTFLRRAAVIFAVLLLTGCNSYEANWNQKMTVNIMTPTGPISGSSIINVFFERGNEGTLARTAGSGVKRTIEGEAVAVDLGSGKYLFALLKGETHLGDAGVNASFVYGGRGNSPGLREIVEKVVQSKNQPKEVPADIYPLLVTFSNINDPVSVRRVDPANLAKTFGRGYALQSITLEITDEPVTQGKVESVLGWIYDVDRLVPKSQVKNYKPGEPIPSLLDFVDWQTFRTKRAERTNK